VILHLADSEATAYIRCRRLIAEPGSAVLTFDPALWAGTLGYFHQSSKEAMEIIRRLRRMTHEVLKTLPEPVWFHTVGDPRDGKVSLQQFPGDARAPYSPPHRADESELCRLGPAASCSQACQPGPVAHAHVSASAPTIYKGGAMMSMNS